jgi:hypothetical protein
MAPSLASVKKLNRKVFKPIVSELITAETESLSCEMAVRGQRINNINWLRVLANHTGLLRGTNHDWSTGRPK